MTFRALLSGESNPESQRLDNTPRFRPDKRSGVDGVRPNLQGRRYRRARQGFANPFTLLATVSNMLSERDYIFVNESTLSLHRHLPAIRIAENRVSTGQGDEEGNASHDQKRRQIALRLCGLDTQTASGNGNNVCGTVVLRAENQGFPLCRRSSYASWITDLGSTSLA